MAKNMKPNFKNTGVPANTKHGITKFRKIDWKDEASVDEFFTHIRDVLKPEEFEMLKIYLRTLVEDETLQLTSFEIKRIALTMIMLDRADKWFLLNAEQSNWGELSIELQKFIAGKEAAILEILRKSRSTERVRKGSLFDLLDDQFKDWVVKGDGEVEGVSYTFEAKKKKKAQMVTVTENEVENATQ